MKKIYLVFLCIMLLNTNLNSKQTPKQFESDNIKVLVVLPNYLGANVNFNRDNMELMGWDLSFTAVSDIVTQCHNYASGLGNINFSDIDFQLSEVTDISSYDVIMIMPATWRNVSQPYGELLTTHFLNLLQSAHSQDITIWATCVGVRVLAQANLLQGVNVTGNQAYAQEYINGGANFVGSGTLPIIDDDIVSSTRGMYFHIQNIEAIQTAIEPKINNKSIVAKDFPFESQDFYEAEKNSDWSKTYGGIDSEGFKDIIHTSDNCIIAIGYTWTNGQGKSDILVCKTDIDGNEIWNKTYGGSGFEYGMSVCETNDGSYVIAGSSTSYGNGDKDVVALKVDADGNEVWIKTFGGNGLDNGQSIFNTSDDYILIAGYTESYGTGMDDMYLLKLDQSGNLVWDETYGGTHSEMGRTVIETSDGNYIIGGSTGSWGEGNRDIYLVKTNPQGDEVWSKTLGDENYQTIYQVKECNNGDLIMIGHTDIIYSELLDVLIIKTDADGNRIWKKTEEFSHRYYDYGRSIVETSEGNFLICGSQKQKQSRENDAVVAMLSGSGRTIWTKNFDGTANDWGNAICAINDNEFIIAGQTNSYGQGKFDGWIFKVSDQSTSIKEQDGESPFLLKQNIPNPFIDETIISFKTSIPCQLHIFNSSGVLIRNYEIKEQGDHQINWDGTDVNNEKVSAGYYYYKLISGNKSSGLKMLKAK